MTDTVSVSAFRDRTDAFAAAAAVVPVVNPRRSTDPDDVSMPKPCSAIRSISGMVHFATQSSGYLKPVSGSFISGAFDKEGDAFVDGCDGNRGSPAGPFR